MTRLMRSCAREPLVNGGRDAGTRAMAKTTVVPIKIEASHRSTLQEQIYTSIRCSIVEGLIGADHRLPSTRALAAELGVSRTTVLSALDHLQAEGYLVTRRGSGTYIAKQLPDRLPRTPSRPAGTGRHPLLSERGSALAQARLPDRRSHGPARAFRLGTPGLDLFPVQLWSRITRECIRTTTPQHLDYSGPRGLKALREAIAEQVRLRGTTCEPAQIAVVAGGQRGLDLAFHLLLDAGDSAWMEEPGYTGARSALLAAGANILPVPVDANGMCFDQTTHNAENVRLAYVTPSHQFPLGVTMSLERRHGLLQWARRSHAWIVEDDYDCEFRYQARPRPCLHALDPDGRVVYVGTFSKTLFPALRLGFLIVPSDLANGFATARLASDVHPPLLEQAVLAEFMLRGHYQRHLRRMQAAYGERLETLQSAIHRSGAPLKLRPVHSGMHAVADLEGVDAERVFEEAKARDIEVMPLSHYYFGNGARANALLLGFPSMRSAAIREGVWRLAEAIDAARRG